MYQLSPNTIIKGKNFSYVIKKVLGQGTFGITYLATIRLCGDLGDLNKEIQVCVKEFFMKELNGRSGDVVTSSNSGGLVSKYKEKFKKEALNLSRMRHNNIVKVLESFEYNGTVYYSMEYLPSGSLDEYIERKQGLSEKETLELALEICDALSFMHRNKMLHLDLKPKNIMMGDNGNIKLIDFGLSKQYNALGEPLSSTSVDSGTPGYAPLEQANYHEGKGFPVTMDVYALGGTMYKMLTGNCPPEASYMLNMGFPSQELESKGVSSKMRACIEKAMSAKKRDGFASVDAFANCLAKLQETVGRKKEKPKQETKEETFKQPTPQDDKTVVDNEKAQTNSTHDDFSGISIFALTKDNQILYCNSGVWQCFDVKSPLLYDDFYRIYPAKNRVQGYTMEDFIRQNKKMLMESKTLITYKHSDSYFGIVKMAEKFSIKPYVIPEIQLIAYGFEGKSTSDEQVTCIKNEAEFVIFESGKSICIINETGPNELYNSRVTPDTDINKRYKLSSLKSLEFLFRGVIKWMDLFEDIRGSLLLSCFPHPIYLGKMQGMRVSHCESLFVPPVLMPFKKSMQMDLNKNENLFVGFENKQLVIDLKDKFGYVPSSVEVEVDVSHKQNITFVVKDRLFHSEIALSLGNLS